MLTRVNAAGEWHCSRCKDFLPRDDFGTDKRTGKPIAMCRECRRTHERKPPKVKPTGRYDPVTGFWKCMRCHWKRREDFSLDRRSGKPRAICKMCHRVQMRLLREIKPVKSTPKSREKRRERNRKKSQAERERRIAYDLAYRNTPIGRLMRSRSTARRQLKIVQGEAARERNRAAIATCDAMIARLRRQLEIEEPERRRA